MVAPNIWTDKCYVTISKLTCGATTSTDVEYGSKTSDIEIGGGERGLEVIHVNTGDIEKLNREEPFEIKFNNLIPLYASDWRQLKEASGTASSGKIEVTSGANHDNKFRLAILWTNQASTTSGVQGITAGNYAKRIIIRDARFTGMEETWEAGGILGGSATFKVPALDSTGGGNLLWQSVDGTESLSALSAYTGGNFGN